MRAVVTGAAGFIGKHLVRRLEADNAYVLKVDVAQGSDCGDVCAGDLAVDDFTAAFVRANPDVVFHLAGKIRGEPREVYRANVIGTVNLLETLARVSPLAKVVVVGSAAEYGCRGVAVREDDPCFPVGAYGVSKYGATLAALDYAARGLDVSVVRPFNLVGPGLGNGLLAAALIAQIAETGKVRIASAESVRDFIDVQDVVAGLLAVADRGHLGGMYNLCSGEPTKIGHVAELLSELLGREIANELPGTKPPDCSFGSRDLVARECGWAPTVPLRDSLRAMLEAEGML